MCEDCRVEECLGGEPVTRSDVVYAGCVCVCHVREGFKHGDFGLVNQD